MTSHRLHTNLSLSISVEVGLASRLISASLLRWAQLATALITDSTVLGFIKLGVPATVMFTTVSAVIYLSKRQFTIRHKMLHCIESPVCQCLSQCSGTLGSYLCIRASDHKILAGKVTNLLIANSMQHNARVLRRIVNQL